MNDQIHPLRAAYVVGEMERNIVRLDELDDRSAFAEDSITPGAPEQGPACETPD